jgi:hypothetical protein
MDQRATRRVLPTLVAGVVALTARELARTVTVAVTGAEGLLREGNAVTNASFSICFMAGPALGGAVVALGGTVAALLANSVLFALIALTLATASGLPGPAATRAFAAGRVRAALAYAREQPLIRALLGLQVCALVVFTIAVSAVIVLADRSLHAGAAGYGALLSAWGAGAVVGSATYARWRGTPARELIGLGDCLLGFGYALRKLCMRAGWALTMSFNEAIFQAVPGAGIVLGGALATLAGPRTALAVGGVGALAITIATWVMLRPGRFGRSTVGAAYQTDRSPLLTS